MLIKSYFHRIHYLPYQNQSTSEFGANQQQQASNTRERENKKENHNRNRKSHAEFIQYISIKYETLDIY